VFEIDNSNGVTAQKMKLPLAEPSQSCHQYEKSAYFVLMVCVEKITNSTNQPLNHPH